MAATDSNCLEFVRSDADNATDAVYWLAESGKMEYANEAACRLVGYSRDELTALHIWQLDPSVRREAWPQMWRNIRGRSPHTFEATHVCKDRRDIPVEVTTIPATLGARHILCCFCRDIRNRKRTEIALKDSEQRFRDFSESSADWYWETDAEHRFTRVGTPFNRHQHIETERLIGNCRWEVKGNAEPPNSAFWRAHRADLAAYRPFRDVRYARYRGTGDLRHFSIDGKPVFDEDGNFQGYRGVARDITEYTQMEGKVANSARRFRALVEGSIQGIIVHIERRPVFVNQAAAEIFGYESPDDILDLPSIFDLYAPNEAERLEAYRQARMHGQPAPADYEIQGRRRNGSRIWLENRVRVVDWDGQAALQITITDITRRRQAERAMRQARDEAEAASRAKSTFLATMSHELRTPLNAILGFSQVMQMETFGPLGAEQYRQYVDDIHSSGDLLLSLIEDMLDISAIEAGKRIMNKKPLLIPPVMAECIKTVAQIAESSGVSLSYEFEPDLPPVSADERSIRQILLNILSNAIKYTPADGAIRVTIDASNDEVIMKVADSGIGIPADKIGEVTEPFSRSHVDPLLSQAGTGLGLSIVKRLVDAHDGVLDIASEEGIGTTVSVHLPVHG